MLVTHEHFDHLDADGLRAALDADQGLELWTNASVASQFAGFGDRVHVVDHGDAFRVAGFDVHAYGHLHAVLHRDIPVIENTGFLIDGACSTRVTRSPSRRTRSRPCCCRPAGRGSRLAR